jgi:hypothetical protein
MVTSESLKKASWEDGDEDLSLPQQRCKWVRVCPTVRTVVPIYGHWKAELVGVAHRAQPCGDKQHLVALHGSCAARVLGKAAFETGQGGGISGVRLLVDWCLLGLHKCSFVPRAGVEKRKQPMACDRKVSKTVGGRLNGPTIAGVQAKVTF